MKKLIYLFALILLFGGVGGAAIIEVPEAVAWMSPVVTGGGVPGGGGNTVSYDNVATGHEDTAGDTVTINKPADTDDGDIMIATITSDASGAITCGGWTEIRSINQGTFIEGAILYKVASSEGADYTFTCGGGYSAGVIMTFSKSGGTWDIQDSSETTVLLDNSITTVSVTATNDSMLICGFGNDDNESVSSPPADMTGISIMSTGTTASMYYEGRSAGGVTKSITYGGDTEELTAIAVILEAE